MSYISTRSTTVKNHSARILKLVSDNSTYKPLPQHHVSRIMDDMEQEFGGDVLETVYKFVEVSMVHASVPYLLNSLLTTRDFWTVVNRPVISDDILTVLMGHGGTPPGLQVWDALAKLIEEHLVRPLGRTDLPGLDFFTSHEMNFYRGEPAELLNGYVSAPREGIAYGKYGPDGNYLSTRSIDTKKFILRQLDTSFSFKLVDVDLSTSSESQLDRTLDSLMEALGEKGYRLFLSLAKYRELYAFILIYVRASKVVPMPWCIWDIIRTPTSGSELIKALVLNEIDLDIAYSSASDIVLNVIEKYRQPEMKYPMDAAYRYGGYEIIENHYN